jgi:hypothetical protein
LARTGKLASMSTGSREYALAFRHTLETGAALTPGASIEGVGAAEQMAG